MFLGGRRDAQWLWRCFVVSFTPRLVLTRLVTLVWPQSSSTADPGGNLPSAARLRFALPRVPGRAGPSCPPPGRRLERDNAHRAPRCAAPRPWQPGFGGVVVAAKWKFNGEVVEALFVSGGGADLYANNQMQ